MSLKRQAVLGGQWTTFGTAATTSLQLVKLAVLARFLVPEEFGLMAIVMVVIGFSQAFADMGISNAIVHRQNITHAQLSSLYWLNIFSGTALALIVIGISPLIASLYDEPSLQKLTVAVSSVFVITSIGQQFRILCQKELQFRTIALITVSSELIATTLAIWLAWSGLGVWALVYSLLAAAALNSIAFFIVGVLRHHRPAFVYRHNELRGFYSFGLFQMGERSINYLSANIDKLLIGKFVGMSATGFYNMAWQLIIFPLSRINPIVNTVAFPTYAKLQDDPETRSRYYSISVKFLSLVTLPLLSFLFFFASEVVWLVFGPGWEQTAILVRILAIVGVGKALGNPGGALILSMGRADVGFWWNVAWAVILTIGMVTALLLWPTVESAAYSLLGLSLTVGMFWHVLIARIGKLHYRPILLYFAKVFLATFVIGGISKLIVEMVALNQVIPQVALALSVFVLLYSIYLALVEREFLMRVIQS